VKGALTTNQKGSLLVEILIAVVILSLGISAAILLVFANQTLRVDAKTNNEALLRAQKMIEDARANSRGNFISVNSIATTTTSIYSSSTFVTDHSQCLKEFASFVNWTGDGARQQKIQLKTYLGDVSGSMAMGGDCNIFGPATEWKNPKRFASDTFNPGKPTAIDVLNRIAYLGEDKTPFFMTADTHGAILGQSGGLFISYTNGFTALNKINDLDSIKWQDPITNATKYYVFTAMNTSTNQLKVIDVTDIYNPVNVATTSLSSCVTGSFPEGWRVQYYGKKLYFIARETAGPEFHIFDVSIPSSPVEYGSGCKGYSLNSTVENMQIRDQVIGGISKRFAYLATDQNNRELRVLDVTNPLAITEVPAASQDLPGSQDGQSVFVIGNKLYFGRQSTPSGQDLYVYDISNPPAGLTLLGSQDINAGVIDIRVAGRTIFLITSKSNKEVQIWDNENLSNIKLVKEYNFTNIADKGMDYEADFLYVTGDATPNFQILYDAP